MEKINNDIKLLKLTKLLKKAHELALEVKGLSYCYVNKGGVDIHISNEVGKDSNLTFVLSKNSWEPNQAKCEIIDGVTIQFRVEEKTVLAEPIEDSNEDKAAA